VLKGFRSNRYIRESHRDDPGRTILEVLLVVFALWTVVQGRRRAEREAKSFVKLSEQVSRKSKVTQ